MKLSSHQCGGVTRCGDCGSTAGTCPSVTIAQHIKGFTGGWYPMTSWPSNAGDGFCSAAGVDCAATVVYRKKTVKFGWYYGICGAGGSAKWCQIVDVVHPVLGTVYQHTESDSDNGTTMTWEVSDTLDSNGHAQVSVWYKQGASPLCPGYLGSCRPPEHENESPPMHPCDITAAHLKVSCVIYPGDPDPCDMASACFMEIWLEDPENVSNAMGKALTITPIDLSGTGSITIEDPTDWSSSTYSLGVGSTSPPQIDEFCITPMRTKSGIRNVVHKVNCFGDNVGAFGQNLHTIGFPSLPGGSLDLSGSMDVLFRADVSLSKVVTWGDQSKPLGSRTGQLCKQTLGYGFSDLCAGDLPSQCRAKLGNETYFMPEYDDCIISEEHTLVTLGGTVAGEPCASADPPCIQKGVFTYSAGDIYGSGGVAQCDCTGIGYHTGP